MKRSTVIVISVGLAIVIISLSLVTNIDNIVFSGISETVSEFEIDTSTVNLISNDYPVDTLCELSLLSVEISKIPFNGKHSDWFYKEFGDIEYEYKIKYYDELDRIRWDSQEAQSLFRDYQKELLTRVNPQILKLLPPNFELALEGMAGYEYNEDEVECNKIMQEYADVGWANILYP